MGSSYCFLACPVSRASQVHSWTHRSRPGLNWMKATKQECNGSSYITKKSAANVAIFSKIIVWRRRPWNDASLTRILNVAVNFPPRLQKRINKAISVLADNKFSGWWESSGGDRGGMSWGWEGSDSCGPQDDRRQKRPLLLLSWLHFVRPVKMTVTQ